MASSTIDISETSFADLLVTDWESTGFVPVAEEREQVTDAKELLRDYVAELAADEKVFGAASALRLHGRTFEAARQSPDWLIRGRTKQCYKNAAAYASVRDDVYYAEGYAIDPALPIPIEHAWLVDLSGEAIEPTWGGGGDHVYLGVVFERATLVQLLAANGGEPGILINWHRFRSPTGRRLASRHGN